MWHQAELVSTSQPWISGYLFHAPNNSHRPETAKATRNLPMSQQKDLEQNYLISQEDEELPGVNINRKKNTGYLSFILNIYIGQKLQLILLS